VSTEGPGPQTITGIPAGDRRVALSAPGHEAVEQVVAVPVDGTARLQVALLPTEPLPAPRRGLRLAAGGLVGIGVAAGGLASWEYVQARRSFQDYLSTEDDDAAVALYESEVQPRRIRAGIEGGAAVLCVAAGAGVWIGTRTQVSVAPGQVRLTRRW